MYVKLAIVTAVTAVAAFALVLMGTTGGRAGVPQPVISIDMDISDGACVDIDPSLVQASGSFQAAVCLVTNPNNVALAAYRFNLLYDDTIIQAPEVADAGTALDDNPDANVGTTTFTTATYPLDLGGGWDCSGGVGAFPKGDNNAATGPGNGSAFSGGCGSAAGPNQLITGPLAVVSFNIVGSGSTELDLDATSVTDDFLAEVGSCDPAVDVPAICNNGTFSTGAVVPTDTPTATETTAPDTETPTATNTTAPDTETPTPTNTTAPDTETPTATNTTQADTETPTPTNTTAPDTETPTATNTTAPDTETPTPTNTTAPDTETPTPTNTTAPDTETPTATNTTQPDTETPTATNTTAPDTATPTNTNTPSPTATTPAGDCEEDVNNDGKVNIKDLVFVAKRLFNDDPAADVDGDGDVDLKDLKLVLRAILRTLFGGTC
jgi:hypothetical protein